MSNKIIKFSKKSHAVHTHKGIITLTILGDCGCCNMEITENQGLSLNTLQASLVMALYQTFSNEDLADHLDTK